VLRESGSDFRRRTETVFSFNFAPREKE
jgi:hypothetical protein